ILLGIADRSLRAVPLRRGLRVRGGLDALGRTPERGCFRIADGACGPGEGRLGSATAADVARKGFQVALEVRDAARSARLPVRLGLGAGLVPVAEHDLERRLVGLHATVAPLVADGRLELPEYAAWGHGLPGS